MGVGDAFRKLFGGARASGIRVTVLVKGRIGAGWHDLDHTFVLEPGTTLGQLIDTAERNGVAIRDAIANSPHLRHTLMLNGERCPVDANRDRELHDGDQIYLLAPLAGG